MAARQINQWFQKLYPLCVGIGVTVVILCGAVAQAEEKKETAKPGSDEQSRAVDVLMIGQFTCNVREAGWPKLQAACAAKGIRLSILGEGVGADSLAYDKFTTDLLKQFHVVLFIGLPSESAYNPCNATAEQVAAFRERLDAYCRAGGGIIWTPVSMGHGGTYWNDLVGKRYDAESLEEAIYDPAKEVCANPMFKIRTSYIWTTSVSDGHAVTEGVRGLLMPLAGDWSWPGTVPMKFGKNWTTLVKGMDSTITIGNAKPVGSGMQEFKSDMKGSYSGAPEIIGVRDSVAGSGRMMVIPFFPAHTWKNFNNGFMGDAVMLNGAGGHPSDGMALFVNGCRWLAEPALQAGLGGYTPPKAKGATIVPPIDWSKAEYARNSWSGMGTWWNARIQEDVVMSDLITTNAHDFKGVFGIRSAASDGKGTVAEYAAEAKQLGLSYIVFLEDLAKTDDTRYAKLVADCKANSDEEFLALPGYLFRDTIDVLYFVFNVEKLPLAENLTPERCVKVPNDVIITADGYRPSGIAELGKLKLDPWYLLSYFTIAPYVYDDAKLIDDGFDVYRSMQGRMHHYKPVGLTMVRAPDRLRQTVEDAPLTVVHAESLTAARTLIARNGIWNPNPVYVSSGPAIERWGVLNPIGQPFAPGRERTRFTLEAQSRAGIAEVRIIDAKTGKLFRHFKPNGDKSFRCIVDEEHKDQWYLIPVVTDVNGRFALGPTLQTYQDGHRLSPYLDGIDAGTLVIGWDDKHRKLLQFDGWLGHLWSKGFADAGDVPGNTRPEELKFDGFDGGGISGSHCSVSPAVITDTVKEPKFETYRFENRLAAFDYAAGDYMGDVQYLENQRRKKSDFPETGWWAITEPPVPMEYADIVVHAGAVRARHHAPVAAKINEVVVTFKKDCTLKRIDLCRTWRSFDWGPMFVAVKDRDGESSWQDDGKQNGFSRNGVLDPGGYIFPASDCGGAPAVINMGTVPLAYSYGSQRSDVYIDGGGRQVKAGEKIVARFLVLEKSWEGQNSSIWLKKYVSDFAIGGGKPGYQYEVTQGRLKDINYSMYLDPANGGAAVSVNKYDLPHNLLVEVGGMPPNAVVGRYDLARRQLLILPVFEGKAITSVNTTLDDTKLYMGELFHCDNLDVLLSCVQDGADKLLVELHNPTDKAITATLSAVPGFVPLGGFDKTLEVAPYSSVKLELPAAAGSLVYQPYQGD